ncbi:MAG: FRG domain-containing protein [Candidatus Obscuribacterales bacterium]|nr:FRG domain-containing protein [Candidatus Obscuribacterales bacterium]
MTLEFQIRQIRLLFEATAKLHIGNDYSWDISNPELDIEFLRTAIQSVQKDANGIWQAESPWIAALFLTERQAKEGFATDLPRLSKGETKPVPIFKKIFRGQKAHYDNIRPSAWRDDSWTRHGIEPEKGENWLACFCLLMKFLTESKQPLLSLPAWLYHGAAQHYQIPTDLLDWTIDPYVSIWFAHQGDYALGTKGRVYMVNLEHEAKVKIVLPPPFVNRLYRQRGFFHYTTDRAANEALLADCEIVEFPLFQSYGLPNSYPYPHSNQLLLPSPLLMDVRQASLSLAKSLDHDHFEFLKSQDENLIRVEIDKCKEGCLRDTLSNLAKRHSFTDDRWEINFRYWVIEMNNYVNWLCSFNSATLQTLTSFETLDRMISDNRDSMFLYTLWILNEASPMIRKEGGDFARHVAAKIREMHPEMEDRLKRLRT